MSGLGTSRVGVGEWITLAGDDFSLERAFDPATGGAVLVPIRRLRLVAPDRRPLAEVDLGVLPASFAEPGLAVQTLERIYLAEEARHARSSWHWPHLLIHPTIHWSDLLACQLRAEAVEGLWTGTIRLKWCQGEEAPLARREVVLWTHAGRRRAYLDRARALDRQPDVNEYQVAHWGALLALEEDELGEVAVRFVDREIVGQGR